MELEVLDVDPLGAERLGDPGQHARAVGHVHAQLLELARVGEGVGEHAPAVAGGLADPAGEKPRIPGVEGRLELFDPATVLGERFA